MTFKDLNLREEILSALDKKGYEEPTPIQAEAIPVVLEGKDVLAAAQTGTGKTAGFTLPLLNMIAGLSKPQRKKCHVLILCPTRELAAQIHANVEEYSAELKLTSTVVFGGVNVQKHIKRLKQGVDILIATPGRLLDLFKQRAIHFDKIKHVVLDEADRMLDMGFLPDIKRIINELPEKRQTLMFSATFSKEIKKCAADFLNDPVSVEVTPENSAAESVRQEFYLVDKKIKCEVLHHLFKKENWYQALVFTRTKHGADKVAKKLKALGYEVAAIHGNKTQNNRIRALNNFKSNKLEILVATDIAARGIDIKELPHVVNFDLPHQREDYVHRIGRTGRAGEEGHAVSFIEKDDGKYFASIKKLLNENFEPAVVPGFEPSFDLKDMTKYGVKKARQKQKRSESPKKHTKSRTKRFGKDSSARKKFSKKRRPKK